MATESFADNKLISSTRMRRLMLGSRLRHAEFALLQFKTVKQLRYI
jgi:hypothetical protein